MLKQSKILNYILILCIIFLCVFSGCDSSKMESPEITAKNESVVVDSSVLDMETSSVEQKEPADKLVPQELLDTLDGWYVYATGIGAHKYKPIKNLYFCNSQYDLTYGDLWKWDNYQYEGVWGTKLYIAYDENQTSPIVFPALFKELKLFESLGISTMVDDINILGDVGDTYEKIAPVQTVEVDWNNLESMTWLLSLSIGSDEMGEAKEELFECVKKLKNLKTLSIQDSTLTSVPDVFSSLTQLENISLLETTIQKYPLSFYQLDNLKILEVSHGNNSPFDSAQLNGWPLLSKLQLDCTLPDGNYTFPNLEELWFSPDDEGNLPEVVSTFENLKRLSIYGDLKAIPESYKNLINLKEIDLYSYSEQKFYEDICNSLIESIQKERACRGLPPSKIN